jgi:proline-specific peptidase
MGDREGYVRVEGGLRLFYRIVGSGPDIVVISAACFAAADLERLAQGRTVIFYDQRGSGASDTDADESHIWTNYEPEDLEAIRQHFGLEQMLFIGWSYNGGVAALYAMRHPERLKRLILMCSIGPRSDAPYDDPEARKRKAEARIDPAGLKRLEEMRQAGLDIKDPVNYCREYNRVYRPRQMGRPETLSRMRSDSCIYPNAWPNNASEHWRKHFPPDSWKRDWRPQLASVKVPTLVIHGMEDLIPLEASREWAAALPNARLLVIPGVGHFPHLESPEVFFPAVDQFLKGEWPEGAEVVKEATI